MRKKLALVVTAAMVVTALTAGIAVAGRSRTTVTIKGPNGDFNGKIKSVNPDCLGDRTVRLFMASSANGPFERTGNSDTSSVQGEVGVWSMGNTGLRDGFFQARAKKTDECRGGRSRVLELVDGVPQ